MSVTFSKLKWFDVRIAFIFIIFFCLFRNIVMAGKPKREVDPRAEARSRREQLYLKTRTVIRNGERET